MKKLISYIVSLFGENYDSPFSKVFVLDLDDDTNRLILPIRPLIIGGDDITFICEGRLGIHLAEKLLEYMATTPINNTHISACAGVSIVHTKSPFYKAYQLTVDLIKKAKESSRSNDSSWLHFMVSTGGFSGSYNSIVSDHYTLPDKRILKAGPYSIDENENSFQRIKSGMKMLTSPLSHSGWPRNKLINLRDTLRKDEAHIKLFVSELKASGLKLPLGGDKLWTDDNTTLYYDMIELLDFYPQELLNHEV